MLEFPQVIEISGSWYVALPRDMWRAIGVQCIKGKRPYEKVRASTRDGKIIIEKLGEPVEPKKA